MHDLSSFYRSQIRDHEITLATVTKKVFALSMLRLLVFVLTVTAIYFFIANIKAVLAIALAGIAIFLFLVSKHSDAVYQKNKLQTLVAINTTEIQVLARNFHHLPNGSEYQDPTHFFSHDIDLFGKGSFFQYSNRTALQEGSNTLAALFTENDTQYIALKQEAIKELADMPIWRQEFLAIASMAKSTVGNDHVLAWINNHKPFTPPIMRWLPMAFSLIAIVLFLCFFMAWVPGIALFLWLLVGLALSGRYMAHITKLRSAIGQIHTTFSQYHSLLKLLEDTEFKSVLLQEKKAGILAKGIKTSALLNHFSQLLNQLDQNNNVFYLLLGNGFFLRALATSHNLEKWLAENGNKVSGWFDSAAFFDAYISLGTFAFNHPGYVFPKPALGPVVLRAKAAGHPLLDPAKNVKNDLEIGSEQFFIITGANMAGKSTFLRTVSLQIMMANLGLPVCAEAAEYNPIKLITSMRTSDSLTDDESYFYAELKRLKFIVGEINNDRYFIVLDEILKGTNSVDKATGSRKFIEKLVASKSTGIIATHDLSLCEVANQQPQIKNYYFDAEIINDELHFDYTFKKGICQNMNASFLLKKMGIVD